MRLHDQLFLAAFTGCCTFCAGATNADYARYDVLWDKGNLGPVIKKINMLQHVYAREALKNGLKLDAKLGTNPYKFGILDSTDSHTSLVTAAVENFFG